MIQMTKRRAPYHDTIRRYAPAHYDPRHVEAFMRLEHSTLDGLHPEQFAREVQIACACINQIGHEQAEKTAESMGL
jgi:hypothetical protein